MPSTYRGAYPTLAHTWVAADPKRLLSFTTAYDQLAVTLTPRDGEVALETTPVRNATRRIFGLLSKWREEDFNYCVAHTRSPTTEEHSHAKRVLPRCLTMLEAWHSSQDDMGPRYSVEEAPQAIQAIRGALETFPQLPESALSNLCVRLQTFEKLIALDAPGVVCTIEALRAARPLYTWRSAPAPLQDDGFADASVLASTLLWHAKHLLIDARHAAVPPFPNIGLGLQAVDHFWSPLASTPPAQLEECLEQILYGESNPDQFVAVHLPFTARFPWIPFGRLHQQGPTCPLPDSAPLTGPLGWAVGSDLDRMAQQLQEAEIPPTARPAVDQLRDRLRALQNRDLGLLGCFEVATYENDERAWLTG